MRIPLSIKRSALVAGIHNRYLRWQTRGVEAYVFVATTGRSGSSSLARIMEAADGAVCSHEPYPDMTIPLPISGAGGPDPRASFTKLKRIYIRRQARGHRYYVETNHQFVKRFLEPAIGEFGQRVRIIHLRRAVEKVAASFHAIGSIPGRTARGRRWLLDPWGPDNLVAAGDILDQEEFQDDLFPCLWYWYEVETRIRCARQRYPDVLWHELRTEDLNDQDRLVAMFDHLRIDYSPAELRRLAGRRENRKLESKSRAVDLENLQQADERLRTVLEARYGACFWEAPSLASGCGSAVAGGAPWAGAIRSTT